MLFPLILLLILTITITITITITVAVAIASAITFIRDRCSPCAQTEGTSACRRRRRRCRSSAAARTFPSEIGQIQSGGKSQAPNLWGSYEGFTGLAGD